MALLDVYQGAILNISDALQEVFDFHRDPNTGNRLIEIGDYALSTRGKMLRGIMLMEACRAVGGDPEKVTYAAAGTEYGHLASLVHDDIIDQDELRRGKKTIWHQYGTDFAILAGDFFIFQAYYSLSLCRHTVPPDRVARTFEVLSKACIDLCFGQALETILVGNCLARSEDYIRVVRSKTGSLFRAAVESGAVLGGGTDEQIEAVRAYGDYLGIAFQIIDDLLCYKSDDQTMRKPKTSDTKNRRITLPVLYGLSTEDYEDRNTLLRIFNGEETDGEFSNDLEATHDLVTAILYRTGAIERAEQTAKSYYEQALESLLVLPVGEGRKCLELILDMAVRRLQ